METIHIRPAAPGDHKLIAGFNAAMALETEHITLDAGRLAAGVAAVFADSARGFYLIAERAGVPAGQMMITREWSDWRNGDFWWIQSVYVLPEHRRCGVFTALFRHVEAMARTTPGVCGLRLYVESANHSAQSTYAALGMLPAAYRMFEIDFVLSR